MIPSHRSKTSGQRSAILAKCRSGFTPRSARRNPAGAIEAQASNRREARFFIFRLLGLAALAPITLNAQPAPKAVSSGNPAPATPVAPAHRMLSDRLVPAYPVPYPPASVTEIKSVLD